MVGTSMRSAFGHDGLITCLASSKGAAGCPNAVMTFTNEFGSEVNRPSFLAPVTYLCGARGCAGDNGGYGISAIPPASGHIGDWVLGPSDNGGWLYQPADRFWPFQFIEAGIFAALTAAALGTAVWLLHRRAA